MARKAYFQHFVSGTGQAIGLLRTREDDSEEVKQAVVRVIISALAAFYIAPTTYSGLRIAPPTGITVLFLFYLPFSCLVLWWMKTRPSNRRWRRTIAIFCDMPALTYAMSIGGDTMLPIFALLLWVAVGNGLRFGPRYLVASTVVALLSITVATIFNDYMRQNPYIVVTLTATAVLVPAYIYVLLDRVHRAYQAAQEANISKSRFLAQASHDLRQPVHAISLFTACLRDANLQASELQMVDNIDRSLQSVSRLFKSLLDVSTLDSGKVVPRYEAIAIAEILDDVLQQNNEAAHVNDCKLGVISCNTVVITDRALLTTMLQNIVNNAIKYAPGRSITIGCRRENGALAVQVYDQGPGILEEHQQRVFEEFYQVRARGDRDVDGVGLGLPIVRRLAHLMNMQVRLRSVPERGTCVTLAGLKVSSTQLSAQAPFTRPPRNIGIVTGLHVLLVEDDEAVLRATASLLRKWGCEVQEEINIPVQPGSWHLVMTDFDLGEGRTGSDCIVAVRTLVGWSLPAVVMSGHDATRVREELSDDSIPILSKPVRPAELRSIIMAAFLEFRGRSQVCKPRLGV
ncbi:signal transduction histidine kinase [Rhizobium skierniewicense]|uniref:histidine kinase n=1 Tax=Rhizobium skierniewicense TaxID=984260 RepID=A0A7W6G469_9HYPH|nr:hybrid sensor histidine kinase/response regulator [Rhizobium skierniewicense]MBB3948590.1 signal transduction histidine kinase [Rhizobium skierniewicense]